jgi:hypothetical protein
MPKIPILEDEGVLGDLRQAMACFFHQRGTYGSPVDSERGKPPLRILDANENAGGLAG